MKKGLTYANALACEGYNSLPWAVQKHYHRCHLLAYLLTHPHIATPLFKKDIPQSPQDPIHRSSALKHTSKHISHTSLSRTLSKHNFILCHTWNLPYRHNFTTWGRLHLGRFRCMQASSERGLWFRWRNLHTLLHRYHHTQVDALPHSHPYRYELQLSVKQITRVARNV